MGIIKKMSDIMAMIPLLHDILVPRMNSAPYIDIGTSMLFNEVISWMNLT